MLSSELPAGADADLLAARPEDVSDPIAILEHRHVLGFLNTPIRVKRFFSRHFVSDQLGQETSAVVLMISVLSRTKQALLLFLDLSIQRLHTRITLCWKMPPTAWKMMWID